MRKLDNFYVKNKLKDKQVFFRLSPVIIPEDDFTYNAKKITRTEEDAYVHKFKLTYRDILKMYEEGFYTIEKYEFDRAEALAEETMQTNPRD